MYPVWSKDNQGHVHDALHSLQGAVVLRAAQATPNLCTTILDFRGFDSSIILTSRGGILTSTGNFPESLSQASL